MIAHLRLALRLLVKSPGFTAVVVLTLGLGIGACTAIFSVVHGVVLKPLPYPDADRVVIVGQVQDSAERPVGGSVSPVNFIDWRDQSTVFSHLVAYRGGGFNVTGLGDPQRLIGMRVGADYFKVLGTAPALGRDFTAGDDRHGAGKVALISHALWQSHFGGAPDVIDRKILLNAEPFTIIGVMPGSLQSATACDLWLPIAFSPAETAPERRDFTYINAIGRLKPGVTLEQARSEMNVIAGRLERQYPATNTNSRIAVIPQLDYIVGPTRPVLLALLGAVGALLLIACANVANLLMARATTRSREIAVRTALGASRSRVIAQLLAESLVLAAAGGVLGVLIAKWGLDAMLLFAPSNLPRAREIGIDTTVLAFTSALVLLTGIGFGLVPALQSSRINLVDGLKDGARGAGEAAPRRRMRSGLVIAELALSLMLLTGAGLLMRSFSRLSAVDPGFNPALTTTIQVGAPGGKYPRPEQRVAVLNEYAARFRALPGVIAAGATNILPLDAGGENVLTFSIEGREPFPEGLEPAVTHYTVSDGYFEAMGIALVRGRTFTSQDHAGSTRVLIVSQGFADRYFPGEDPIGKHIDIQTGPVSWRQIVGVVRDVRHLALDDSRSEQFYEAMSQQPASTFNFVIRMERPDSGLAAALRDIVREIDPDQPVVRVSPVASLVAATISGHRFGVMLFGVFSALALILAAVGIYGVMAYTVSRRTSEFGVRMALGATTVDVFKLVLRDGLALVLIGLATGLAGSLVAARLIGSILYRTSTADPIVFTLIAVLLGSVAVLACLIPAHRASTVDPIVALRSE